MIYVYIYIYTYTYGNTMHRSYLHVHTYACPCSIQTGNANAFGAAEALLIRFFVALEMRFAFQHDATTGFSQAYRRLFESDSIGIARVFFAFGFGGLTRVGLHTRLAGVDGHEVLERNRVSHNHIFGVWVRVAACTEWMRMNE